MKVACLGAGYFSRFHIDAWRRIEGARLVGVCDADIARAEATGAPAFVHLEEMLRATRPGLLDIILPPKAHRAAIEQAVAAGVEAIICQKPFCTSIEEAKAMARLTEKAGIPLIVHENFRFQPWYRVIKAAMAEGRIGTPLQASFRFRPGDGQGPQAYLDRQPYFRQMPRFLVHETAVHWIDTFGYLFGPIDSVYADLVRLNPAIAGEDAGHIIFEHVSGVRSHFDGNRLLDHDASNTRCTMGDGLFEGTKGVLSLHGDGSVDLRGFGARGTELLLPPDDSRTFGGDCVFHLQAHVIEALRAGKLPQNTAPAYLAVLKAEDATYRSAQSGSKIRLQNP